tara:strand:+ start:730 stop:1290 length:561 start_codon:yes stop_codon:yes gene_type:complete
METLLLNDQEKINDVKLFFENNEIEINLKNSLHIEDISSKTTGILILSEFQSSYLRPFIDYSLKNNIKVLAVGRALISLISTLNNSKKKLDRSFTGDGSTFISLGSKLAEIIGGAGPLKTNYFNDYEISIENTPKHFLPSSINLNNGCIEAIESVGKDSIIGVVWPIFSINKMPSRFENILSWISD